MQVNCRLFPVIVLLLAVPGIAGAGEIRFSGYVTQGYYRADTDQMDTAGYDKRGSFELTLYALKIAMNASERLALHTEIQGRQEFAVFAAQQQTSLEPEIVVAEGRYAVTDELTLRAGIMKQPFGFYNEVRNVGILYETTLLPSLYNTVQGFMNDNLRGVALTWDQWGDVGSILLDAYFGEMNLPTSFNEEGLAILPEDLNNPVATSYRLRNLCGGRLSLREFIPGLELAGAGYVGWDYDEETGDKLQWSSLIASGRWQWRWFHLSGEWTRSNNHNGSEAWYAMAGLVFFDELEVYGILDRFYGDREHRKPGVWGSLLEGQIASVYKDTVIGFKWQPLDALVLKAEWHEVRANVTSLAGLLGTRDPDNVDHFIAGSLTLAYF